MQMEQKGGHAPRSETVAQDLVSLKGPCIDCETCKGVCVELIEVMTVPNIVLRGT